MSLKGVRRGEKMGSPGILQVGRCLALHRIQYLALRESMNLPGPILIHRVQAPRLVSRG